MSTNTQTAAQLIAAAAVAHPGRQDHVKTALGWMRQVDTVAHLLDLIGGEPVEGYLDEVKTWTANITKVTKDVRYFDDGTEGVKAVIHLDSLDTKGQPESISTNWVNGILARACAETAKANIGRRVRVIKRNRVDPTGESSNGFRTCVWIVPLDPPSLEVGGMEAQAEAVRGINRPGDRVLAVDQAGLDEYDEIQRAAEGARQDAMSAAIDEATEAREDRADYLSHGTDPF